MSININQHAAAAGAISQYAAALGAAPGLISQFAISNSIPPTQIAVLAPTEGGAKVATQVGIVQDGQGFLRNLDLNFGVSKVTVGGQLVFGGISGGNGRQTVVA